MHRRWTEAALFISLAMTIVVATVVVATVVVATITRPASAQQGQKFAQQPSIMQDEQNPAPAAPSAKPSRARGQKPTPAFEHDPDLDSQDQFAPSQVQQPLPDAVAMPSGGGRTHTRAAAPATDAAVEPGAPPRPVHAGKPNIIACNGVFAKDSSHTKLASAFQSRNVSYTQVDTNSGGKAAPVLVNIAVNPAQACWKNNGFADAE